MRERVHRNARPDASKRPRSVVKLSTRRPGRIICFTKLSWPTKRIILSAPVSSSSSIFLSSPGFTCAGLLASATTAVSS